MWQGRTPRRNQVIQHHSEILNKWHTLQEPQFPDVYILVLRVTCWLKLLIVEGHRMCEIRMFYGTVQVHSLTKN